MALSNDKVIEYSNRLLLSRVRILNNNGFYGLLLMHMSFALDENCKTASTDGRKIYFGPKFLDEISDKELDFIMMHEILHVVLKHCLRQGERDNERFNIACDIVVNSNILRSENMDYSAITLKKYGVSMHLTPGGREGYEYSAEEVYMMLPYWNKNKKKNGGNKAGTDSKMSNGSIDDHTRWGSIEDETLRDEWEKRLIDACEAMKIRDPSNKCGLIPICAERILKELKQPKIDWRRILNEFVYTEITDYSFTPPDRRFEDCPYFLPDYNEPDELVRNILFMIDTSGSMSDDMITDAYSEVKGAIDQYDGKLKGWLGFFDAKIVEPKAFVDESEFETIRPFGGGGTNFQIIFEYVREHMQDNLPTCIIILTDGYARFPSAKVALDIPVLWVINNDDIIPPWGKVARI